MFFMFFYLQINVFNMYGYFELDLFNKHAQICPPLPWTTFSRRRRHSPTLRPRNACDSSCCHAVTITLFGSCRELKLLHLLKLSPKSIAYRIQTIWCGARQYYTHRGTTLRQRSVAVDGMAFIAFNDAAWNPDIKRASHHNILGWRYLRPSNHHTSAALRRVGAAIVSVW